MRILICLCIAWILTVSLCFAEERVLQHDKGAADTYESLTTDAHYVEFRSPATWKETFISTVSFYGYREGDPGEILGTIVVWAPKEAPKGGKVEASTIEVFSRAQFDLRRVPDKPGWFTVALEPAKVSSRFAVSVFTYGGAGHKVHLGLTPGGKERSVSSSGQPALMLDPKSISVRRDGRNWMVRAGVSSELVSKEVCTSDMLCGPRFAFHDDGTADGFATAQKNGPIIEFTAQGQQQISRVYVYGKLEGNWFQSTREAAVWILDDEYGIIYRAVLPYARFTNVAGWGYAELPQNIKVSGKYYVLVEPVSRPELQMLVGYDTSAPNAYSSFGTAGAPLNWSIEAPQDRTTWMVRVEYR